MPTLQTWERWFRKISSLFTAGLGRGSGPLTPRLLLICPHSAHAGGGECPLGEPCAVRSQQLWLLQELGRRWGCRLLSLAL